MLADLICLHPNMIFRMESIKGHTGDITISYSVLRKLSATDVIASDQKQRKHLLQAKQLRDMISHNLQPVMFIHNCLLSFSLHKKPHYLKALLSVVLSR
jgi:hypothetical protein